MIVDPLPLQITAGDISFELESQTGAKTIRRLTIATRPTNVVDGTVTISHDSTARTGRKRSVLRVDLQYVNPDVDVSGGSETCAAYLVLDRHPSDPLDSTAVHIKKCIAMILSFFTTDPTAAASGNIPYDISTTNGVKFVQGQP